VAAGDRIGKRVVRLLPQAASLLVLLGFAWAYLPESTFKDRLANLAFDSLQRLFPREHEPTGVWVLDIDEESLSRYGQWPWPRNLVAQMVAQLGGRGVAAIGFDMVLAEPDRTSPARALAPLLQSQPDLARQLSDLPDYDAVLAAELARNPTVMGFVTTTGKIGIGPDGREIDTAEDLAEGEKVAPISKRITVFSRIVQGKGETPEVRPYLPKANRAVLSLPDFYAAAKGNATFSFQPDQDGVVRRVHLMWRFTGDSGSKGHVLPGLAIETLRVGQGAPPRYVFDVARGEDAARFGVTPGIQSITVGRITIPTDRKGAVWLHYAQRPEGRYVPAWKLLTGDMSLPELGGSIVLVGTSAPGLLDLRFSPLGIMPGVEMHAQVLDQILTKRYLHRPEWAESVEVLAMALAALPMIFLVGRFGALGTAALGGAAGLVGLAGVWWAFTAHQLLFAPIYPWLGLTVVYLVCTGVRFFQAEREGRFIREAFASYMSPNLVDYLVANPDQLKLGGERRDCSFVLTDLAGFTTLVEKSEPEQLVALLNDYLEGMTSIALKHEGTLDRIVGDAVAVMFSAPVVQPDHAARAVACALEMDAFSRRFSRSNTTPERRVGRTRITAA
jgi:adenylate cyclase